MLVDELLDQVVDEGGPRFQPDQVQLPFDYCSEFDDEVVDLLPHHLPGLRHQRFEAVGQDLADVVFLLLVLFGREDLGEQEQQFDQGYQLLDDLNRHGVLLVDHLDVGGVDVHQRQDEPLVPLGAQEVDGLFEVVVAPPEYRLDELLVVLAVPDVFLPLVVGLRDEVLVEYPDELLDEYLVDPVVAGTEYLLHQVGETGFRNVKEAGLSAVLTVKDQLFSVDAKRAEVLFSDRVVADEQRAILFDRVEDDLPDVPDVDLGGPVDDEEQLLVAGVGAFEEYLDDDLLEQLV